MVLLRSQLDPSAGIPSPVILQPRRRMNQAAFYGQPEPARPQMMLGETASRQAPPVDAQQAVPTDEINSRSSILSQFQRLSERSAPPQLDPIARVQSPNAQLVQPSNFESFYKRLTAIRDANDALLGAAQARSAHKRAQEAAAQQQALMSQLSGAAGASSKGGGSSVGKSQSGQAYGNVPSNPAANFKYAKNIAGNFGWDAKELSAWYTLGMKESGWRNTAQNPTSTAYGIGQFLNSTWAGVGIPKTSDPAMQVEAMARYIRNRYGSPSRALAFHLKNNWY